MAEHGGLILGTQHPRGRECPLLFPKHRCCPPGVLGLGQEQRRHWESRRQPWGAQMEAGAPLPRSGRSVWWDFTCAGKGQRHVGRQPALGKWLTDRITLGSRVSQLPR